MVLGARIPHSSYYDARNRPGASLYRARQPYLVKNALTGVCIVAFVAGVYSWTIRAIGQDDFSDVPIPDAPVQPGNAPHMSTVKSAGSAKQ
ncbi:Coiled-coil domain-containing protein 56 [Teratosphaeria destructans]|uniref:Cytochrome c oxidase assembly factor 3 n=1 Tax=Teratosphaeria destructans TaxID=418781 RepID=A0A9W7SJT6_9PEZI|nr:Coiled-coil domain-containing protein 56 [Teratosphaeria destructans]